MSEKVTSTESFVSYPEVKVTENQGATLRSYKMRIKLASSSSDHINFTPTFANAAGSFIWSVRQSVEMPCFLPPYHFAFFVQMEEQNRATMEESNNTYPQLVDEFCALYLIQKDAPEDQFILMKFAVNVVCGCKETAREWKNALISKENFLDCGYQPMRVMSSSSPVLLSRHHHDYTKHGLQQEYFLTINVFDFSKAPLVPLEAQRLMAKKKCSLQLREHVLSEWVKPYDVTIKCKGGYSFGVHKVILSVRSSVFKSMLESDLKKAKTNIIHVVDLNAPVMKIMLFFIYTGELESEWMKVPVEEILYGADKYELRELLSFFDHLMIIGCNFHNALRLAQLAERHSLRNARESILDFVVNNLGAVYKESLTLTAKRV